MTADECRPVEVTVEGQTETIRVHGGALRQLTAEEWTTGLSAHGWSVRRCEAHRDWMSDLENECPDPCPDCRYEPLDSPATSTVDQRMADQP